MEIPEIKSRLTITQVLEHYHLKPDRNHRLLCPFHEEIRALRLVARQRLLPDPLGEHVDMGLDLGHRS